MTRYCSLMKEVGEFPVSGIRLVMYVCTHTHTHIYIYIYTPTHIQGKQADKIEGNKGRQTDRHSVRQTDRRTDKYNNV